MPDLDIRRSKILIVDDHPETIEILRRQLSLEGYREIESTSDPLDAVRLFREFQPDLVILDWRMPGLAGCEVLAALRAIINAESLLPIFVVTGDSTLKTRREALARGASDFLTKPYDTPEIMARIGNLLEARYNGRQQAEAARRESDERFSNAFEHAPIGKGLAGLDGRWLKVNPALCALVGYTEEELLVRTFMDITHPDDLAADVASAQKLLAGDERIYQRQKRYLHKEGHPVTILLSVSLVRDLNGAPSYFIAQMLDYTERQAAQAALQESRHFLRSTLDALTSHIAILDEHGTIIEVNLAWRRFAESNDFATVPRGLGDNYLALCDSAVGPFSDEAPLVAEGIRAVMAGRRDEFQLEYPCHGRGEQRWFVVRVTRFGGEGPIRVVVAHESVTERKLAEEALRTSELRLRTSEGRLRTIVESEPECVKLMSLDGLLLEMNPAGLRMIDADDLATVVGAPVIQMVHPDDRTAFADMHGRVSRGETDQLQFRIMSLKGRERWLESHSTPLRGPDGAINSILSVTRDVTVHRRIKEELFRSRETLRGILDNIPQRVFWKDRASVYLGCNKPCAHDMGLRDPEDVVGLTDFDLSWKAVAEIYRADDRAIMELDAPKSGFEEPSVGLDGQLVWIRTTKVPLHDGVGRVIGILGTYEDVTEHKKAIEEIERLNAELEEKVAERTTSLLAATLEAERANNAKGDFLSRISHELRTPMNAILGFGQLLEMEEDLGPEPRESIEQILLAGRHLLTLINEMLDLSSAEAGRLALSLEPVAVEVILEEVLHLVQPLAAPLGITLPAHFADRSGWVVLADRERLKQVLLNLVANAIKYNRPGGTVALEVARAEAALLPSLRVCVIDTGPGLSPQKLARLFTPFDRLDAERARQRVAGAGLGLALSKQMVELMGGSLGVASVVGTGSTFWVELPCLDRAE